MKIQCNACEVAEAKVLCCADEAALCWACDQNIYAANKLASKHQRVPLSSSSSPMPKCDICQDVTWVTLYPPIGSGSSPEQMERILLTRLIEPFNFYPTATNRGLSKSYNNYSRWIKIERLDGPDQEDPLHLLKRGS